MIGLLAAVGDFLPLAFAIGLSPVPIVATVVVLARPDGPAAGTGFAAGWIASLSVVMLLLTFALGELDSFSLGLGAWLQIGLGLLLIGAAAAKWRSRPRDDAEPPVPGWMGSLASAGPGRAALFGGALGANPKNLALAAAAAASIGYRGLTGPLALIAAAVFVALSSATVIAAVLARTFGGHRGAARLEGIKTFMLRHNAVIMMVIFLLIGLKILGDGLGDLGS